tara:strand:+ start:672 stop:1268 length:597 start_codon:yes stop_codon:yes gene_type:complete
MDDDPIEFRGTGAGKEFEGLVLHRLKQEGERGLCSVGRYGVQAAVKNRQENGDVVAQLMRSLPDIEGVLPPSASQFVFDCKVMSGASFNLSDYRSATRGAKRRQLTHMYDRQRMGACCFFLIHMNPREMKTKTEYSRTVALPVCDNNLWEGFEAGEWTTLSRSRIAECGYTVVWNASSRERTLRPDVLGTIRRMREDM